MVEEKELILVLEPLVEEMVLEKVSDLVEEQELVLSLESLVEELVLEMVLEKV